MATRGPFPGGGTAPLCKEGAPRDLSPGGGDLDVHRWAEVTRLVMVQAQRRPVTLAERQDTGLITRPSAPPTGPAPRRCRGPLVSRCSEGPFVSPVRMLKSPRCRSGSGARLITAVALDRRGEGGLRTGHGNLRLTGDARKAQGSTARDCSLRSTQGSGFDHGGLWGDVPKSRCPRPLGEAGTAKGRKSRPWFLGLNLHSPRGKRCETT